jgi:hypothetical protein
MQETSLPPHSHHSHHPHSPHSHPQSSEYNQSNDVNIHENPSLYFRETIREARSRARLCEFYSAYLEDFAIVEDNYGKNVVKVRRGKEKKLDVYVFDFLIFCVLFLFVFVCFFLCFFFLSFCILF